jgi:hypothetical protein
MQVDRLIRPKNLAGCNPKDEAIGQLPGSAGDGDSNWRFHAGSPSACLNQWLR